MIKRAEILPALSGYETVKRFWAPRMGKVVARIMPGEIYVTRHPEVISTVLGSCVSACMWDPNQKIGGMNHFMLPLAFGQISKDEAARYGIHAMELLINGLLRRGAERSDIRVKLAGGGRVIESSENIGAKNARFALEYLSDEGFQLVSQDLEGNWARVVRFDPLTGRVQCKKRLGAFGVKRKEKVYAKEVVKQPDSGGIELF